MDFHHLLFCFLADCAVVHSMLSLSLPCFHVLMRFSLQRKWNIHLVNCLWCYAIPASCKWNETERRQSIVSLCAAASSVESRYNCSNNKPGNAERKNLPREHTVRYLCAVERIPVISAINLINGIMTFEFEATRGMQLPFHLFHNPPADGKNHSVWISYRSKEHKKPFEYYLK